MKVLFACLFLIVLVTSCMEKAAKSSSKSNKKEVASQTLNQNGKDADCDSGKEVLKKIEEKKESFSLNNLESGCSIDSKDSDGLKL